MKEIKSWEDKLIRVQHKGSRFVVLKTCDYVEKVEHQIIRSSFSRLDEDPSPEFKQNVNNWLDKWFEKITEEWKKVHQITLVLEKCMVPLGPIKMTILFV